MIVIEEWLSGDFKHGGPKPIFVPTSFYFQIAKDKQTVFKKRLKELVESVGPDPYLKHVITE